MRSVFGDVLSFFGGDVFLHPPCASLGFAGHISCHVHDWRNPRLGHRRLWVDPREGRSLPLRAGGFGLKDVKGAMFSSPAATWRHHTSSHSRSLIFRIPDGVKIVKRKCFRKIEDVENFDCSDFQVGYFLHNQGSRGRLDQQQNWRTSGWHRMSDCYDTSSSNSLILLCSLVWIITKPTHSIYVIYVDIESSWSWLAVGEEHHTMMALKSLNGQLPLQDYFNPKPLAANPVRFVTRLTRLKPGGPIRPVLERSRWWAWFVFGTCSFSVLQGSNISSRHVWQSCMFQCITVTASYIEQHHWLNSPQLSPYPLISWHPTKGFKWWARAASAAAGWWGTSPENAASWRRSMSPPCPNSTGQKPPPKSPCWRNWCIPTSSATETPSWMAACCVSSWTLLSKATSIGSLSGGRSQGPCCQRLWWWGGSPKSCWRWSTCMSATSFTETWRPKISSWQGLGRATWSLATLALLEFCGTPQIVPEHTLGLPTTALQRSAKNNHTATSLMFGPWAAYFMKWQLSGMHLMQILCVTWSSRSCEVCRHKCPAVFSEDLRSLIAHMLTKDPRRRPSVHELVQDPLVRTAIHQLLLEIEKLKEPFEKSRCTSPAKSPVRSPAAKVAARPEVPTPPKGPKGLSQKERRPCPAQATKPGFARPRSASRESLRGRSPSPAKGKQIIVASGATICKGCSPGGFSSDISTGCSKSWSQASASWQQKWCGRWAQRSHPHLGRRFELQGLGYEGRPCHGIWSLMFLLHESWGGWHQVASESGRFLGLQNRGPQAVHRAPAGHLRVSSGLQAPHEREGVWGWQCGDGWHFVQQSPEFPHSCDTADCMWR